MSEYPYKTIRDLRKVLAYAEEHELTDDDLVVMARDEEGNSFSPFEMASHSVYVDETGCMGHLTSWDDDDFDDFGEERLSYEEWLAAKLAAGARKCLVLWPLN